MLGEFFVIFLSPVISLILLNIGFYRLPITEPNKKVMIFITFFPPLILASSLLGVDVENLEIMLSMIVGNTLISSLLKIAFFQDSLLRNISSNMDIILFIISLVLVVILTTTRKKLQETARERTRGSISNIDDDLRETFRTFRRKFDHFVTTQEQREMKEFGHHDMEMLSNRLKQLEKASLSRDQAVRGQSDSFSDLKMISKRELDVITGRVNQLGVDLGKKDASIESCQQSFLSLRKTIEFVDGKLNASKDTEKDLKKKIEFLDGRMNASKDAENDQREKFHSLKENFDHFVTSQTQRDELRENNEKQSHFDMEILSNRLKELEQTPREVISIDQHSASSQKNAISNGPAEEKGSKKSEDFDPQDQKSIPNNTLTSTTEPLPQTENTLHPTKCLVCHKVFKNPKDMKKNVKHQKNCQDTHVPDKVNGDE